MKISIIIPSYNYSKYLSQAIQSTLRQTYNNKEIIVVDDCSTDGSQEIIKDYTARYPDKIKGMFNEVNFGMARALNIAIAQAKGDFYVVLCADDYLYPLYLERMVKEIKPGIDLIFSKWSGYISNLWTPHEWNTLALTYLAERNFIPITALVRRKEWKLSCGYDSNLKHKEDWNLWKRICTLKNTVVVNEILWHYREHNRQKHKGSS